VRLVVAVCSVDYTGRLSAHLPSATRLLMVKADGSVSVHSDGGAYKPLNWMTPPCTLREEPGRWTVVNKAGEQLIITIEDVLSDVSADLGIDPGLVKDGVEAHLQVLLAEHCEVLGATSSDSTVTRCFARYVACSPRRKSSRRHECWRHHVGSTA
jgi:RecB family endonuclease NucS